MLREEIKQLQDEIAMKNEMVITMKRQIELDQDAFLEKQSKIAELQEDVKSLDNERINLLQERAC